MQNFRTELSVLGFSNYTTCVKKSFYFSNKVSIKLMCYHYCYVFGLSPPCTISRITDLIWQNLGALSSEALIFMGKENKC